MIDSGRAQLFAAHLPLARTGRASELGTRHHAALGLSNVSDALVLVVSEERGVVSVAREGRLTEIAAPGQLVEALHRHRSYRDEDERASLMVAMVRENLRLKIAAVIIAAICWWQFVYDASEVYRTFLVPVQYRSVPEGLILSNALTRELKVTLVGKENAFKFLAPSALVASIDVAALAEGQRQFTIIDEMVRHPANLRVSAIEPRSVRVPIATK